MSDNAAIGDEVRRSLSAAGFTVKAASERAGLSYRTVLRYIKGERDMPLSVLLALMNASGADLVDLARRLQPRVIPEQSSFPGTSSSEPTGSSGSDTEAAAAGEERVVFESKMRGLGIQGVSVHAAGPLEQTELSGAAAVIAEIVTELRKQQK
ncbi:helix-turn-helix domain-containing protein [Subtercola boreus]|uniref:helix-turn-helix domain-containing protein n=1 Tax=Subtercola boreus TaxID=120213 RepID=UPI0011C04353|nr:helix-turn-helix transcriptional regulator [Subtercola boreus]